MDEFSREDQEVRKRAVFEAMSPRRQRHIAERGYENWDPFQEPKDPIEIRRDAASRRTAGQLVQEFLASLEKPSSDVYGQAVMEMAMGLIRGDDRVVAMYEFSGWYRALLESESLERHPE